MNETWLRPIEKVALAVRDRKIRVVGVTSPRTGSGVTLTACAIAETLARSGVRTLLIDLTGVAIGGVADWKPGEPGVAMLVSKAAAGYDLLSVRPVQENRLLFNNSDLLRHTFDGELGGYANIVLDLPAVLRTHPDRVSPLGAAAACDGVLLVCVSGRDDPRSISATVGALTAAGSSLTGTIMNEFAAESLGEEFARIARELAKLAPALSAKLVRRTRVSSLLN